MYNASQVMDMDLYVEMLREILYKETVQVTFPNLTVDQTELLDSIAYRALKKIRDIVRDESLRDEECFKQIEAIVCVLESIGSGGGNRHDFR